MSDIRNWINSLIPDRASFILPTIDGRKNFLSTSVRLIREQSQKLNLDYEIIIVCDGFTPDADICGQSDIKVIHLHKNSGSVCIPRNIGISFATGQIIAPTDDDVFIFPNKIHMIKRLIDIKKNNITGPFGLPIAMIYGIRSESILFDVNTMTLVRRQSLDTRPINHWVFNKKDLGIDNGQLVYLADVYEKIKPQFPINACDWNTYSKIAQHYDFECFDNKTPVCNYIWHSTESSSNISMIRKENRVNPADVVGQYISYFAKNEFSNLAINHHLLE